MTAPELVSIIVAVIAVLISICAYWVSRRSDKRMKAIANLEFLEKMAMMEFYSVDIEKQADCYKANKHLQEKVKYDIKSCLQLSGWVDKEIEICFYRSLGQIKRLCEYKGIERLHSELGKIQPKYREQVK